MKKKLATKTLSVVTPRHSIKLNERVVRVVPNAPRARADYQRNQLSSTPSRNFRFWLTPAPRDFGASTVDKTVSLCRSTSTAFKGFSLLVEASWDIVEAIVDVKRRYRTVFFLIARFRGYQFDTRYNDSTHFFTMETWLHFKQRDITPFYGLMTKRRGLIYLNEPFDRSTRPSYCTSCAKVSSV